MMATGKHLCETSPHQQPSHNINPVPAPFPFGCGGGHGLFEGINIKQLSELQDLTTRCRI